MTTQEMNPADGFDHDSATPEELKERCLRMERALISRERRYRALVENASDWLWEVDASGCYTYASPRVEDLLGYEPEEIIGESPFSVMAPEEAERIGAEFAAIVAARAPMERLVNICRHKDGHEVVMETSGVPFFDEEGELAGYRGVDRDITLRKREQDDVQIFFDVALDLLCIAGFDGYFKKLSPTWFSLLGWSDQELKAQPFIELVHEDDRAATVAAASKLGDGGEVVNFTNRYKCKDGSYRWLSWNSQSVPDRQLIIAAAHDITQRKEDEEEIQSYREHLEELVRDRTSSLQKIQETVTLQAREILEISTPVMKVWDGLLVAPLIGSLDSRRTQQLMERLLEAIVETRSEIALVDITGVPVIDTQTAQNLLETTSAVRLLGARVVLTGVSPAIAQTLVHLGVDMTDIVSRASLSAGLSYALETLGLALTRVRD